MIKYSVTIASKDVHGECFREIAETIAWGLTDLGVYADQPFAPATVLSNHYRDDATNIVLGWNCLSPATAPPEGSILYNLEQVSPDSNWFKNQEFLDQTLFSPKYRVWDYDPQNAVYLKIRGREPEAVLPIGYHPCLRKMPKLEEAHDVVFFGSLNRRRELVLDTLRGMGVEVVHKFGVYGKARDEWCARAKVVLNLHFYDANVFEVARCSYLLANERFVVSETSGVAEQIYGDSIVFAYPSDLPRAVIRALQEPDLRWERAVRGRELMESRRIEKYLKEVIPC